MKRCLILTGLAVIAAGCTPSPPGDLAGAVQPSEIADVMCRQARPGGGAVCRSQQLPDQASATAYGMCLQYHPLDVKACKDLRLAYEAELRAYLSLSHPALEPSGLAANEPQVSWQRARELHKTAEALYIAASRDAQTFAAAQLIPDVRRRIEAVLRQNLPEQKLRQLADQAHAEALYWYAYMQGLERVRNTS